MELYKLENLRDTMQDRIRDINGFVELTRDMDGMVKGKREALIEEVEFLEPMLQIIYKEIENHVDDQDNKPVEREDVDGREKRRQLRLRKLEEDYVQYKNEQIDKALTNAIIRLTPFHQTDYKYWSQVHEIIDDCYRLQDFVREDIRVIRKGEK